MKQMLKQALERIRELEEQHAIETAVSPTDLPSLPTEAVQGSAEDPAMNAQLATNTDRSNDPA